MGELETIAIAMARRGQDGFCSGFQFDTISSAGNERAAPQHPRETVALAPLHPARSFPCKLNIEAGRRRIGRHNKSAASIKAGSAPQHLGVNGTLTPLHPLLSALPQSNPVGCDLFFSKAEQQPMSNKLLEQLTTRRAELIHARNGITNTAIAQGRDELTETEDRAHRHLCETIKEISERLQVLQADADRDANRSEGAKAAMRANAAMSQPEKWGGRAARRIAEVYENRALTSGSIDLPSLVEPQVAVNPHPQRVIDLVVNRQMIPSNSFEYFKQSVRTNNAANVADAGTKPTSVFTVTAVQDRARVVAHLSQPFPVRLFQDAPSVTAFLENEMRNGVLNSLENGLINGNGSGEAYTGILATSGTTAVAFTTDVVTTLRRARTALQALGETPTGWLLNPADAEAIDLLRTSTGGPFLADGYGDDSRNASTNNVFGDSARLVSPLVPAGTAILADWNAIKLYVREDVRLDVDLGGTLFDTNQAKMRAEMRAGVAVLRPQAIAVVDLA